MNRGNPGNRIQQEIENFLAEVTGVKPKRQAPAADNQKNQERRARRRQQAESRRRQQEAQEQLQRKQAAQKKRAAQRKRGQRQVGSGISEHVDQYINQHVSEHIDNDVDEYVEATIVDNVEENLGKRDVEMPKGTRTPRKQNSAAADVAALLRDPTGVRNAILINEILSRPAVLRRDSGNS